MPDYGDILAFLSKNPPQMDAERDLHASLLELLAYCLRTGDAVPQLQLTARDMTEPAQLHLHFN